MIGGGQARPVARGDCRLISGRQIVRGPRLTRHRRRFDGPARCGQRLGQPRSAVSSARFVGAKEGEHRRPMFAGAHLALSNSAHSIVLGPVGIGGQETRIIGERIAVTSPEPTPIGNRIIDLGLGNRGRSGDRDISGGKGIGLQLGKCRPAWRCCKDRKKGKSSHAGHDRKSVLIRR